MSENKPQFPAWVSVFVNIFIALVLVGSFYYFYIRGNLLAWSKTGTANWPSSDPILDTILTGVGGIMAAVFAVALNLPRSPIPRNFRTLTASLANVLNLVPPKPATPEPVLAVKRGGPGWGQTEDRGFTGPDLVGFQTTLGQKHAIVTLSGGGGGGGGGNGDGYWSNLNAKALLVFAVALVISYPVLTIMSVVSRLWFASYAPQFVLNFAGAGLGVLVAALAVWVSQITKGR